MTRLYCQPWLRAQRPQSASASSKRPKSTIAQPMKANSNTPGRTATLHGFRSSSRDWASEQGYARDLAERALAHTVSNKI
ncbi:hypothetical protein [Paraburkholderia tuberum]|uniref:hypothetical protein n=1 Tax=Paraburkholderia TaxID=1822464 RepID=UPI001ABD090D|nr:hypothetical protein [Paraburkholderia tuberum]